jgi:hypothetical protein
VVTVVCPWGTNGARGKYLASYLEAATLEEVVRVAVCGQGKDASTEPSKIHVLEIFGSEAVRSSYWKK